MHQSSEKVYRDYEPEQLMLLPPSLNDWLPKGHLTYFISDVVNELDLSQITAQYEQERRGYPPYNPTMMVKVLLYGYCTGTSSSRRIARKLEEDVAYRVLAAGNQPDFRTISDFRKRHLKALQGLFIQILRMCQKAGLVKLGHVSLDGTKIKANASKHKAMSYGRMKKAEKQLAEEIAELLRKAEEVDAAEDARYGKDRRGDELPLELARRDTRLKKIREAKEALEAEARAQRQAAEEAARQRPRQRGRKPKVPEVVPADKAQRNFTDPESRIMKDGQKAFVQAYNAQAAVDETAQVIVSCALSNQAADGPHLKEMTQAIEDNTGEKPKKMTADAGYFSQDNVKELTGKGIDPYIAVDRQKHSDRILPAARGRIPSGLPVTERMRRKLRTKAGKCVYAKRKQIVEPVFGQIKHGRGFRQFNLRGLEKVRGEWSLVCTTHNLLKLFAAVGAMGSGRCFT